MFFEDRVAELEFELSSVHLVANKTGMQRLAAVTASRYQVKISCRVSCSITLLDTAWTHGRLSNFLSLESRV